MTAGSPSPPRLGNVHRAAYVLLCAIWGSTWMAIRVTVEEVPPLRAAGLRFLAGAALLAIPAIGRRLPLPRGPAQWQAVLLLALGMIAAPYGLLFWAERHVTSSMAAVLFSLNPLAVAFLSPFMKGHAVPRRAVHSMVLAAGGIAVLFTQDLSVSWRAAIGGAAVLGAVFSSAASTIYAKRTTAAINPLVSTGLQLLGGSLVLLAASAVWERKEASYWTVRSLVALLFLAVFGSALAFAVYYWLLRRMHAYQLSTITLIVPLVAMLEGWLLLGERISALMLMAATVVLVAVGLVLRSEAAREGLQPSIYPKEQMNLPHDSGAG